MTQPAKVQEPSMEEILASIRRIIADDEAKPAAASPAAPAPAPAKPAMKDVPPSAIPAAPAAAKPAPAPPPKAAPAPPPRPAQPPPPEPAASNNQDDIDAMLASLEEDTAAEDVRSPQPDGDVFELTDEMALPDPPPAPAPPPAAAFSKIEPQDDLEFTEARTAQRQPAPDPLRLEMPMPQILSRTTVNAVESAFNTLAHTVLSNNARTLEDLVKEMLRPMLKSWLDDNLPGLVERIVKAEIERVSRGR
jgi:cell pole-organizing protein PopZ